MADWFDQNKPKADWFAENAPTPPPSNLPGVAKAPLPEALKPEDTSWNVKDFVTGKGGLIRTGLGEAVGGIEHMAQPGRDAKYSGASQAIRGVGKAMIPAALPVAATAIPETLGAAAVGLVGGKAGRVAAQRMGGGEGAQDLAEDLASVPSAALGGWIGGALKNRAASSILNAIKSRYGLTEISKVPKERQSDLAFALFQERNGRPPATASEKVNAIKEMRDALKATPKAAAKAAKPAPAPNSPSLRPPSSPPKQASGLSGSTYDPAAQLTPPPSPKGTSSVKPSGPPSPKGKLSGPTSGSAYDPKAQIQPINKLTGPAEASTAKEGVIANQGKSAASPSGTLTGPTPHPYESVKRTETGAVLRRENFKAYVAKNHPDMTREKFLALSSAEKNKIIRAANPQSVNRPYIESSKVFEEFANHVWPK